MLSSSLSDSCTACSPTCAIFGICGIESSKRLFREGNCDCCYAPLCFKTGCAKPRVDCLLLLLISSSKSCFFLGMYRDGCCIVSIYSTSNSASGLISKCPSELSLISLSSKAASALPFCSVLKAESSPFIYAKLSVAPQGLY